MSKKIELTKRFEVTCNKPQHNTTYTFIRKESYLAQFGNGTCVLVYNGLKLIAGIDTRFDKTVMADFDAWCDAYLAGAFDPSLEPKWHEV